MNRTEQVLNEVRATVAPSDETLKAVRDRRDAVLAEAEGFPGYRNSFRSGSIAHGTANHDTDADCGVVLDRRAHTTLGPDGDDVGPEDVVELMRGHIRDRIKGKYPRAAFRLTKRAIKVTFDEPLDDGSDPTVDLIVALDRRDAPGVWIPNLERPGWDPSHPERHTELLVAGPDGRRRTRAHVIRLAKAWNVDRSTPLLCSFNIEALALACVERQQPLDEALALFFSYAAADLDRRLTPDPANVSKPIKVTDRALAVRRLGSAHEVIVRSMDRDDNEDAVRAALAELFPSTLEAPIGDTKAGLAAALSTGTGNVRMSKSGLSVTGSGRRLKDTRAYGRGEVQ